MARIAGKAWRFAGAALSDPETFDFIDVNPGSLIGQRRALELAKRTGKPLVATSDNNYPRDDHRAQFLSLSGGAKVTPQHLLSEEEWLLRPGLLTKAQIQGAIGKAHEIAEDLTGLELPKAPMIKFKGDLRKLVMKGKRYRIENQHITAWTPEYEERLQKEMKMIKEKEYESYFLVVADLVQWAKGEMLVGPARGSSAGSLVCYLLRITEVDPLVFGLLFERFIDVNRADLPDIDIDFSDNRRYMVFDYLADKYGEECVARLGNISTLQPRSAIAEVGKRMRIPIDATFAVRNAIIEYSSGDARFGKGLEDTLENTTPGKKLESEYPEAFPMRSVERHAWHSGVHAAGVLVCNYPVTQFCTVRNGIAQIDKPDSEYLNLLKIDALGLRTLGIIEDAGVVDAETLFGLKLDDPEVINVFNSEHYAGLFQFEGQAQRKLCKQVTVDSFTKIDHITAVARPGPLGGGAAHTYVNRAEGREPAQYRHKSLEAYLGDTFGVVLYQEQVMNIVREIGQFSWSETSTIRKAMSGRKGVEFFDQQREKFIAGAGKLNIPAATATVIWEEICTFGAWGMNRSHTVSYSVISYWCAYMKTYHPLEYAAALLRNTDDEERCMEMLRELVAEGVPYRAFDPELSQESWAVVKGELIGGFENIRGVGKVKARGLVQRRAEGRLTAADKRILKDPIVQFAELNPVRARWAHLYDDPEGNNIRGRVRLVSELVDGKEQTIIVQVKSRIRADKNETRKIAQRGGEVWKGQSKYVDIMAVDDSISKPIRLRCQPRHWFNYGEKLADHLKDGEDYLLVRGRWMDQYSLMSVTKVKCLTNPEILR